MSIFAGTNGYPRRPPGRATCGASRRELLDVLPHPLRRTCSAEIRDTGQLPEERRARGRRDFKSTFQSRDVRDAEIAAPTPRPRRALARRREECIGMAGGQERILRRRIKSSPVDARRSRARWSSSRRAGSSQAQARVAGGAAVQRADHRGRARPRRGRRRGRAARCSCRAPRSAASRYIVIAADRGLCGALQLVGDPRRRAARSRSSSELGRDYVARRSSGRKAESYFRFRDYRIDAAFTGFCDQPTYEDARRIGAAVTAAVPRRRRRPRRARLHAFVIGRHARRSSSHR